MLSYRISAYALIKKSSEVPSYALIFAAELKKKILKNENIATANKKSIPFVK